MSAQRTYGAQVPWPEAAFGPSGKIRVIIVGLLLAVASPVLGQTNRCGWETTLGEARRLAALHAQTPSAAAQFDNRPSVAEVELHFLAALQAATNAFQAGQIDRCMLAVLQAEYAWFLHSYGSEQQRRAAHLIVSNAWYACPTNPVLAYKYASSLEQSHRALVYAGKQGDAWAAEQALSIGQRLVKEHPEFVRGWLGLASQLIFRGKTEEAKTYLKKYLELTENETNLLADLELVGYQEDRLRYLRRAYAQMLEKMEASERMQMREKRK